MKIFILAPAYHPHIGGAETYARVIATGLADLGEEVTVITDGARLPTMSIRDDVHVERLRVFEDALLDSTKLLWEQMQFALLDELSEIVSRNGVPDVIFANSNDTAIVARMLGDSLDVPVVGNFHEQAPEAGPLGVGRARLVYSRLNLEQIISGSDFYRSKAIAFGARPERVHLIPHGVDIERFQPSAFQHSAGKDTFRIVLSGRIAPRKQQRLMVRVFERLVIERGLVAELILAGRAHSSSQEYADALDQQIADSDVSSQIRLVRDLSLTEMPDLYRSADVVVQPSTAEGLGLAVLEGMACGVPVAIADTTGLQEIVRDIHDGFLLDPHDETAWVDALEQLALDDSLRQRLATHGRELVESRFSQARMIRETRSLLAATVAAWANSQGEQLQLIEG